MTAGGGGRSMDRFWTLRYPPGVPAEIDAALYPSIVALFDESFRIHRAAPAYACMGRTMTFGELDRLSAALGAWFQGRGLRPGDRVAVMLPNILPSPVAAAAVLRAGLVLVNVNPLYTARELRHQLRDSGAVAIVVLENFAHVLQDVIAETPLRHVVVAAMGDLLGLARGVLVNFVVRRRRRLVPAYSLPGAVRFAAALAEGRRRAFAQPAIGPKDVAVLQYTGGTTGVSKGATLRHETIIANLLSSEAWLRPGLARRPTAGPLVFLCALPLYHVYAFISCSLLGMRVGGLNVLIPNPRDISATIRTMSRYRINVLPAVNTLFNALLAHPEFARLDFSGLRISSGGSMPVQDAVARRWREVTGCPICEGYGLSETASGVVCNPTDAPEFTGTIGLPMPSVEIRILDDDGRDVAPGGAGEIAVRGPQVMAGYWRRPDETDAVMTRDGFFKTGDVGTMDARGYITLVDRKKDMIVVSGLKVYPNEVEAVVMDHPGVFECAAIGVPDARSGEVVKLFVVRRDPELTDDELARHCAEFLAPYKRPRRIEWRTSLPKSVVGKILRRDLRDAPPPGGPDS
jgi:long-chain acyl-CoA synthetase